MNAKLSFHPLDESGEQFSQTNDNKNKGVYFMLFFVIILFGMISGFALSELTKNKNNKGNTINIERSEKQSSGILDKKTFKDSVEGILKEGGIDGEGQYHLERPGGPSQNAYLTSTSVDLSEFVGKKIRVWGQTIKGQKAGWLMDVGYVEVL